MSKHPALPLALALALALLATTAIVTATLNSNSLTLDRSTTSGEPTLTTTATPGTLVRFETSSDLKSWQPLATVATPTNSTATYTDTAAFTTQRHYRAVEITDPTALPGDHFPTANGSLTVHVVEHASFVITWNGITIYNDPVGSANLYRDFPKADLVLVGHRHGDHHSDSTIDSIATASTRIIAPSDVQSRMSSSVRNRTTPLANGATLGIPALGLTVRAIPAYNANHPRNRDNGYVLTAGGLNLYMAGDTGPVQEMRDLENIDVAFLPMNVPFTMTIDEAAAATLDFAPATVFPYHYRNQNGSLANLTRFKTLVAANKKIAVRLRDWY